MGVLVVVDLYCARRRDWSLAAAEVDGDGGKHGSESGEEVWGLYGDEEEGVRGHCSIGSKCRATGRARLTDSDDRVVWFVYAGAGFVTMSRDSCDVCVLFRLSIVPCHDRATVQCMIMMP